MKKAMGVPFFDSNEQYQSIKGEVNTNIQRVMDSCRFVLGENVNSFEKEFASFCGTEYAAGVANGTDGLRLALLACGVGKGDEVITVPHTFIATTEAISHKLKKRQIEEQKQYFQSTCLDSLQIWIP